jgi:2-methylcitrate dehydratase PrpD
VVRDMNFTNKLAEHVESIGHMQLSPELVAQVKRALLDYCCVAYAGSVTEVSQTLYRYLKENEGGGAYNAIGYDERFSVANAAFLNGTSAHCLDFDDGHSDGSIHPGAVVFPAVIALAEKLNPSTDRLIKAVIAGYEVCLRISAAMHPASRQRGIHNTPAAGIFGAAAACAFLLGGKSEQIEQTMGCAASFAGGLFAFLGSGSEVKRIHPGQAARDAVIAAELCSQGLTGPKGVLENQNGFFKAFAGNEISVERMFKDLGKRYEIMNIYIKPYPCCRHLHVVADTIYEMKVERFFDINQLNSIEIGVNSIAAMHSHKMCNNLLDAQMSIPYTIAAALIYERLGVEHFYPTRQNDDFWRLVDKVMIFIDEEADALYPKKRAARVRIKLVNGENVSHFVDTPLGEPSKPMSDEQIRLKFIGNSTPIIGEEKAERIVKNIELLEQDAKFLFYL